MKATSFQQFHDIGKHEHTIPQELCYICGHLSHAYGRHTKDGKTVQTCSARCEQVYKYNESILVK